MDDRLTCNGNKCPLPDSFWTHKSGENSNRSTQRKRESQRREDLKGPGQEGGALEKIEGAMLASHFRVVLSNGAGIRPLSIRRLGSMSFTPAPIPVRTASLPVIPVSPPNTSTGRLAIAQERFQFQDLPSLASRVCQAILSGSGFSSADRARLQEDMAALRFIPAGNTLTAGVYSLRPNCCTLGSPSPDRYVALGYRLYLLFSSGC